VSLSLVLGQVLNGVVTGMLYALMGVGLSLILGILNLPNFAHGTLYALGAYLLFTVATWTGSFWVGLLIAPLGVAVLGAAIEVLGMRRLYAAGHDFQLLLTFGLALILEQVLILVWGPIGMSLLPPRVLGGAVDLGVTFYPRYRLFAMVVAGLLILAVWLGLERTRLGAIIRAGIEDKDMVSVLGIDVDRVFTLTFAVGAWLAGVAGALMVPIRGLTPTMGADILGIAFVVVALGGLGNLPGAMLAGIVIGLAQSLVALVWPVASIVVIFAVMAVVLLLRPQGLFGTR
jgi:branched-chain amino acid transport system permease protein